MRNITKQVSKYFQNPRPCWGGGGKQPSTSSSVCDPLKRHSYESCAYTVLWLTLLCHKSHKPCMSHAQSVNLYGMVYNIQHYTNGSHLTWITSGQQNRNVMKVEIHCKTCLLLGSLVLFCQPNNSHHEFFANQQCDSCELWESPQDAHALTTQMHTLTWHLQSRYVSDQTGTLCRSVALHCLCCFSESFPFQWLVALMVNHWLVALSMNSWLLNFPEIINFVRLLIIDQHNLIIVTLHWQAHGHFWMSQPCRICT